MPRNAIAFMSFKKQYLEEKRATYRAMPIGKKEVIKIRIDLCPSRCERLKLRDYCTMANCIYIEHQEDEIVRNTIENVLGKHKKKRLHRIPWRDQERLHNGILTKEGRDDPLRDEICGDYQVWAVPEKFDGILWVSHRVTIYGIRNKRKYYLSCVEVYVDGWQRPHIDCDEHMKSHVEEWKHYCFDCERVAMRKPFRKKDKKVGWHYECPFCGEVRQHKTKVFHWNHICPACKIKEQAKTDAFNWFNKIKLREAGIGLVYLPYERYHMKVRELRRKNSKSIGVVWK